MKSLRDKNPTLFSSLASSINVEQGYEGIVQKLNNSKFFFNRRYLVVKNGLISYFRNPPSESIPTTPNKTPQIPKAKVHAIDCEIKRVDPEYSKKKKKPFMFQISFWVAQGKKPKRIIWIFAVETEMILNTWLDFLQRARHPINDSEEEQGFQYELPEDNSEDEDEEEKLKEIEKINQEKLKAEKIKAEQEENFKRSLELEKRKARQREKEKEENRKKMEIEYELQRLQEEADKKKKEELDNQRKERFRKLLEYSWDYRFQNLWSKVLGSRDDYEQNLTYGIRLFKHLGVFEQKAVQASKAIIDELYQPKAKRRIQPLSDSLVPMYIYQNMIFRLTWDQEDSNSCKLFGHEFRASDMLLDALFLLGRKEQSFHLRVPLTSVIDYKGFRMLVIALSPLDGDRTLLHGPSSEGVYHASLPIYDYLSWIAQVLNLKEHKFEWDERIAPAYVHLSVFTQIHKSLGYKELEEYVKESMGSDSPEEVTSEDHMYMVKLSDLLPIDIDINKSDPDFSQRLRPEFICDYENPLSADAFINSSEENANQEDIEVAEASRHLKVTKIPEIIELLDSLSIMPIDSKSMTQALHSNGINIRYLGIIAEQTSLPHIKDIATVEIIARTCKHLLFQQLAELMLESSDLSPERKATDNIEEKFMGTLGTKIIESNYLDEANEKMKDDIEKAASLSYHQSIPFRKRAFTKMIAVSLQMPIQETLVDSHRIDPVSPRSHIRMDASIKECVVDYLNLVFGSGEESDLFWDGILLKKASENFNISEKNLTKSQINLHALLHAVCYHCSLNLTFYKETELGKAENPFVLQNLDKINEKVKMFSMKNVEYKILAEKYLEYKDAKNHGLSLQTCNLKLRVSKALNSDPEYLGDPALLADIGEILLETGDVENAVKKAKEALIQVHPLHAESVKSWCVLMRALFQKNMMDEALQCFDNALSALDYHWGPYHPLHSTIYSILAFLYMQRQNYDDSLILYKNSLMCCLRVLGPNHPHTAEVYMELGNLYIRIEDQAEALAAFEKGHSIYEASIGKNSIITVNAGTQLAQLLINQGRYDQAKPIISHCCEVHELIIEELNRDKDPENSVKIAHHYDKLYEILALGLTLALAILNYSLVLVYCERLWEVLEIRNEESDKEIIGRVLKFALEAKLKLLIPDKKNLILSALLKEEENSDQEEVYKYVEEINSHKYMERTRKNGGLCRHIDKLIEETVNLERKRGRVMGTDENIRLRKAVEELQGILEVVGPEVLDL